MSSGGSSSSQTQQTTQTTNVDKRQVVDNGSTGVTTDGGSAVITVTDNNAVKNAIDLVQNSGAAALDAYKSLLSATVMLDSRQQATLQASDSLAGNTTAASTVAGIDWKQAAIAVGVGVAITVLSKKA